MSRRQQTILIIDPHLEDRQRCQRFLQSATLAFKVLEAESAAVGLEISRSHPIDLILTEFKLPDGDGLTLLSALRSPGNPDLPVLMVTAYGSEAIAVKAMKAGAADYLAKQHLTAAELQAAVQAAIASRALAGVEPLSQSQRLIQQIGVASVGLIYLYDVTEQRNVYINSQSEPLLGFSPERILAMGPDFMRQQMHPDDLARFPAYFAQLGSLQDGEVREIEYRMRHANGKWRRFVSRDMVTAWLADGTPHQILGVAQDVTEQRRAEAERQQAEVALRQSEDHFRQLADVLPQLIWVADPDGNPEYVSQRWTAYTGLTLEQTSEQAHIEQVIHPDDLAPTYKVWTTCLAAGTPYQTEFRLKRAATAEYRWFLCRAVPIKDAQGQVRQWYGALTDIHDRKQIEAELYRREQEFRALAENSPDIIARYDADLRHLYVSPAVQKATGIPAAAFVGKTHAELGLVGHVIDAWNQTVRQVFATGMSTASELEFPSPSGLRYYQSQFVAELGLDGAVETVLAITRDVTDYKLVEQALQRQTEQLTQANRIKDEFLAVLSHELRTPLNPILGWTKLLRSRRLDAAAADRALEIIDRNAKLQTQLIEDLLDVSRILQGKLSLNVCSVNLAATVEAAIETVRLAAEAKAIAIQLRLDPDTPAVWGDPNRLQQIVWNLLSNAVKFTPAEGRISVCLSRVSSDRQGGSASACLQVTDTGKGIAADFLPHVFDYFRQADSSTTRQFGGLGLGLAIVHHLVELHGGTIEASSAGEGQGAAFRVQLPCAPSPLQSVQSPDPLPESDLSGIRVLVVEDEPDTRDLLAFILEQAGAAVTAVDSGTAALQALAKSEIDILLSDIGMPDMDGYTLLKQVRSQQAGQSLPAIALTAYAGELNLQQAMRAGFQQHLTKPVVPAEITAAIDRLARR